MRSRLQIFERFAKAVLADDQNQSEILAVISEIEIMNEYGEEFSWMFFDYKNEPPFLESTLISKVISDAYALGLAAEFKVIPYDNSQIIFFTTRGRAIADQICEKHEIGYTNLLGSGFLIKETLILSPFVATKKRIKAQLSIARMMLNQGNAA